MQIDQALQSEFPGLRVVELELDGLSVRRSKPELEDLKTTIYQEIRTSGRGLEAVKDEPLSKAYRDFYWRVGIDPTKTRPAAEALTRRVLGGKEVPTINTLVDSYNLVSLKTSVAIAAFDSALIHKDALKLRRARIGESFLGIGMTQPAMLEGVEAVIEDVVAHDLIAVYPFRNAEKSKVTEATGAAFLIMCGVPGIEDAPLETARDLCRQFLSLYCTQSTSKTVE